MGRKSNSKVLLLSLLLTLLWGGCDGGGGGQKLLEVCLVEYDHWEKIDLPNPDMSHLEGTYTLHSFDIDVWVDGVYLGMPISSSDFSSFSGTLVLTADTITEAITVEGETAGDSGTYTVSNSSQYAGTLHVTVSGEVLDVSCAMGPITICDPVCADHFFINLQSERVCEMVPEDELIGPEPLVIGKHPRSVSTSAAH
jgi:hypothetical protein